MRLVDGRGTVSEISWFLAQRDIAREIGLPPAEFLAWAPDDRGAVLELAANLGRACLRSVAAGRLSIAEIAAFLAEPIEGDVPPFPIAAGDKRAPPAI